MISLNTDAPGLRRLLNGPAPGWLAVSRGAALGLSSLLVLNLFENFVFSTSIVENWMTDLGPLSQPLALANVAMLATALFMFSIRPWLPGPVRWVALALILVFSGFCGRELWLLSGRVADFHRTTAMTRPLGVLMLFAVAGIGVLVGGSDAVRGRSSFVAIVVSAVLTILGFTIVTIRTGGLSDSLSDHPVSVILVLSCRSNDDGTPSEAMSDRVRTASVLLKEGRGKCLLFACVSVSSTFEDAETMRSLASREGIDPGRLMTNPEQATMSAVLRFVAIQPDCRTDRSILVVGDWFELARWRLVARRMGFKVSAVAAGQQHALLRENSMVALECGSLLRWLCEPMLQFFQNADSATKSSSLQPNG